MQILILDFVSMCGEESIHIYVSATSRNHRKVVLGIYAWELNDCHIFLIWYEKELGSFITII